jgi:hypothetical protein
VQNKPEHGDQIRHKRLKEVGLINPQLRFTDDGQTSNQYAFSQPERPKPKPAPEQKSTPIQISTPAQMSPCII